jgi:transposase
LRKKRQIRRKIRNLPRRSVVLAEDETDLLLFPPLRASWSLRGQPREIVISGKNARRVIFGAMNVRSGSRFLLVRERQRAVDFQAFLEVVHRHHRGWHVALLLDEDSSHTAGRSQEMAATLDIETIWLPKRSPKLNPMDHLWGHAKNDISANRQYATVDDQAIRFLDYLKSLSATEALTKAGILSKNFWLRAALSKTFWGSA